MDVLPRITRQLFEQFREMSSTQRTISVAIVFVTLAGFGWLLVQGGSADLQPVSFGKVFAPDELASAEKALVAAGLTGSRRDGQRLMAPRKYLDRYNAALLEFDALPVDLGSQMLKQFETLGPFSTDRQRSQMKEALLLQELRRMIKAVPDIEDARVAVAASERKSGWNQKPRATANVTVKPRSGREISATLVKSLRHVVASMIPDLLPADVTVFDVTRGHAYTGETIEESIETRNLLAAGEIARQYEQQIQKALSHIPQVGVTVRVDTAKSTADREVPVSRRVESDTVANRPGSIEVADSSTFDSSSTVTHHARFHGQNDTATDSGSRISSTAVPKAVQVSVSIPRDYLREIVLRRNARREKSSARINPEMIEEEVIATVERIVGRLIPAESPGNAIAVTCVDHLSRNAAQDDELPKIDVQSLVGSPWGISILAIAIGLLGFWSFRPTARPHPQSASDVSVAASEMGPVVTTALAISSPPDFDIPVERGPVLNEEIPAAIESSLAASPELPSELPSEWHDVRPIPRPLEELVPEGEFAFLHNRHADDIRNLISDERPQTIAVIAAQLPSGLAAQVLAGFDAKKQAEILGRLARLGPTDEDVLADVAAQLQDRIGRMPVRSGGIARAADVLRESARTTSREVLQSLGRHDSNLAEKLRESLFSFQDVASLTDEALGVVMQETADCQWAVALKGCSKMLRQRIFGQLPKHLATALNDEMQAAGPLRLSEITAVQHRIAESILTLEAEGQIELPKKIANRPSPGISA